MRNKTTAGIFALFLGGLGVHRFYLGQIGLGILYLVFCWTLIPALVALIDGIIFLTQSESSFSEKYNRGQQAVGGITNIADELIKLNELKEKGVITEGEFEVRKKMLLN